MYIYVMQYIYRLSVHMYIAVHQSELCRDLCSV